jgi:hypothetical protein
MRQAIHIFAKDARHWRWPLALLMALMAMRTAIAPRYVPVYNGWAWNKALDALGLTLPLVWWFLIAAAIHDDSLEGDRQFWLTRPYSWRSLLGAKALFVLAFVFAPLAVSDAIILAADGFSPLTPALPWFECLKLIILLPAVVLASVTRGMRQFLFGCLLVAVALSALIQSGGAMRPMEDRPAWSVALCFLPPLALVAWQFARRRTVWARAIAAAGFVWLIVPTAWMGRSEAAGIRETGAPTRPDPGIRFADRQRLDWRDLNEVPDTVQVDLPVELTGRDHDLLNGILLDLSVQSGAYSWRPFWSWHTGLTARRGGDWLEMHVPQRDAERILQGSARVRAEFAIIVYELQATIALARGAPWTRVPGFGDLRAYDVERPMVVRRTALFDHEQRLIYTARLKGSGMVMRAESSGVFPGRLAMIHLTPVITFAAVLDAAGTPIPTFGKPPDWDEVTVNIERPIALVKRSMTLEGVRLADWVVKR